MNKQSSSLRDLKREATTYALAEAYELAIERGLDGFSVDDVVQRAGYSRRTFANHYACKEEAVAKAVIPFHSFDVIIDWLNNIPETALPIDVMHQITKMELTEGYIGRMRKLVELSKAFPTLEPYLLSVNHYVQMEVQMLLMRLFHERYPKEYIHLLSGAINGAILPLLFGTVDVQLTIGQSKEGTMDSSALDQYLDTVFGYLRNGFERDV